MNHQSTYSKVIGKSKTLTRELCQYRLSRDVATEQKILTGTPPAISRRFSILLLTIGVPVRMKSWPSSEIICELENSIYKNLRDFFWMFECSDVGFRVILFSRHIS
jgi:hypothetical protein